jgi:lipopolysaccharide biosynthesis glycosyltransferase
MGKNKEIYNIGCSANNAFAQHLGVMLFSLLKNCPSSDKINIFVMDGGISQANKNKINSIIKKFKSSITYLKPQMKLIEGLKTCRHISIEGYYRFFLFDNPKIDKILYLDCDLVVEKDILELYKTKFEGKMICAIQDPGGSEERKQILSIPLNKHYFNTGVLLVDCKEWRKKNATQKIIEYTKTYPEKIQFADQDGTNAILKNNWKELNPKWNMITLLVYHKYFPFIKISNYENEEIAQIVKSPNIIHYASFLKPWFFLDPVPNKKRYWFYLKQTPWANYKFPDKSITGAIKRILKYFKIIFQKII